MYFLHRQDFNMPRRFMNNMKRREKTRENENNYRKERKTLPDLGKKNSMNSAEFNFLKDFLPNLSNFPPNLDP